MKRLLTYVNDDELAKLGAYIKKHRIPSFYALLKKALFEYVEKHP